MGKISRHKSRIAVGELNLHRRLALDFIGEVRIAERDVDIVVAMAMHQRRSMRRNLDLEDAHILVFKRKMVRGFRSDLDFSRSLGSQEWNQQEEKQCARRCE